MADDNLQQDLQTSIGTLEANEFEFLLKKEFKPKTDEAKEAVERAVRTLAEQALAQTTLIGADVTKSIEAIIAQIDKKLTEQINLILHQAEFQKLEGAWRGLHYLVNNTETDEMLKIRFMDISKQDLGKTLKRYKGTAWDQSPLFKKIYEAEYGQFGGEPFGCLMGDYYFDQTPPDVELLGVGMSAAVSETMAARSRQIRRVLRLDPLRLRERLPRSWVEALFAWGARFVRIATAARAGAPEITWRDFPIGRAEDATSLDWLAVCRGPRT